MTLHWESKTGLTPSRLLKESAELSLGIEPIDMSAQLFETPLFSGRLIIHEVQPGLIATASDITYLSNEPVDVTVDASLICGVLLAGEPESMQVGNHETVAKSHERPVLVGFDQPVICSRKMERACRTSDAGFVIKPTFFERFGHDVMDDGLRELHEFLEAPFRSKTLMRSPRVLDIARRILDHPYNGELGTLFLESSALNLVVEVADLLRIEQRNVTAIGQRHYKRVAEAREILDHRLVDPPSTLELSRLVGVNVTTLQENFKQVFKTTIFGYVRDQRLQMARILLMEHGLSAAEAGRKVGFSSPSAFAAAYKRRFGYPPKLERGRTRN